MAETITAANCISCAKPIHTANGTPAPDRKFCSPCLNDILLDEPEGYSIPQIITLAACTATLIFQLFVR